MYYAILCKTLKWNKQVLTCLTSCILFRPISPPPKKKRERERHTHTHLKQQVIGQECKKAGFGDSNTHDEENV
jgi:hypothetical protein